MFVLTSVWILAFLCDLQSYYVLEEVVALVCFMRNILVVFA